MGVGVLGLDWYVQTSFQEVIVEDMIVSYAYRMTWRGVKGVYSVIRRMWDMRESALGVRPSNLLTLES